jgi:5-methylcytosine-specific restriction endonuclease McrA
MKKHGRKRILETKYLYCNKHGDSEHVESGIKIKKWKCCACVVDYSTKYRINQKLKSIEYKGGSCERCGYNKYYGSLDFHHKNPLFKKFSIGGSGVCKNWPELTKELDKCQLLCKNCHNELHAEEDRIRIENSIKTETNYHKKQIHQINARKLGKQPSP